MAASVVQRCARAATFGMPYYRLLAKARQTTRQANDATAMRIAARCLHNHRENGQAHRERAKSSSLRLQVYTNFRLCVLIYTPGVELQMIATCDSRSNDELHDHPDAYLMPPSADVPIVLPSPAFTLPCRWLRFALQKKKYGKPHSPRATTLFFPYGILWRSHPCGRWTAAGESDMWAAGRCVGDTFSVGCYYWAALTHFPFLQLHLSSILSSGCSGAGRHCCCDSRSHCCYCIPRARAH